MEVIALCSALHKAPNIKDIKRPSVTKQECVVARNSYQEALSNLTISDTDKDALKRIIYAEAANQGDIGQAFVLFTILNRVIHKDFHNKVQQVINAKNQFEPATKANGWINLRKPPTQSAAKLDTMINLALQGVIPDPTGGALYFQNVDIVAAREKAGEVSKGLTNFYGSTPTTTVKDHTFYSSLNTTRKNAESVDEWDAFNPKANSITWDAF